MKAKRLTKAQRLSLDIITTLPQSIIETILCLLPIEEAARTSILSREWRYKWTKIPKLGFFWSLFSTRTTQLSDFEQTSEIASARKNMGWSCKRFSVIHQVLLLRRGPIHDFTLSMDAKHTYFEIDQIILHLSRNHTVKKLTLELSYECFYELPSSFFSLHHLTDLYLEYCYFKDELNFNGFGSLTSLTLSRVGMSKETLLYLLSNCPSLKSLRLFMYIENLIGRPSIMELFKCLPVIEHLTAWGEFIPLLDHSPEEPPASLIHLKYCIIEQMSYANIDGLTFLAVLMKCSPNLEKIKIEVDTDDEFDVESVKLKEYADILEEYSAIWGEYSDVWLERLNELKIECFRNLKPELEIVKFILARSPNLKKVILITCIVDKNEEMELLRVLLRVPRASPVEIVVDRY